LWNSAVQLLHEYSSTTSEVNEIFNENGKRENLLRCTQI